MHIARLALFFNPGYTAGYAFEGVGAAAGLNPGMDSFLFDFSRRLHLLRCFKTDLIEPESEECVSQWVRSSTFISACVSEFPNFRARVVSQPMRNASMDASAIRRWWKRNAVMFPSLSLLGCDLFTMAPSSVAAESVFSILRQMFSSQQLSALEDYVEGSVMLRHNSRNEEDL